MLAFTSPPTAPIAAAASAVSGRTPIISDAIADIVTYSATAGCPLVLICSGLERLSALRETRDAELLKLGETSNVAIPSQAQRRERADGKV